MHFCAGVKGHPRPAVGFYHVWLVLFYRLTLQCGFLMYCCSKRLEICLLMRGLLLLCNLISNKLLLIFSTRIRSFLRIDQEYIFDAVKIFVCYNKLYLEKKMLIKINRLRSHLFIFYTQNVSRFLFTKLVYYITIMKK